MGMFGGFKERREKKKELLNGLAESEARIVGDEDYKLAELERRLDSVDDEFKTLTKEEKALKKLRKLLHKAQKLKIKLLRKDMKLRRSFKIDMEGKHYNGSVEKERAYAKRRAKIIQKETKELIRLHHEIAALHEQTKNLEGAEASLYQEYQVFLTDLGIESQELNRALR